MADLFERMGLGKTIFPTPDFKLVRRGDPSTSHDAAASIDATGMELVVLNEIRKFGTTGCISDQICAALSQHRYSTVTARYKQLKEKGLIIVDGTKVKASSGRQQMVMWASEYYPIGESNG